MTQPADHRARELALNPFHSYAVTAPAGSGKTGLLTKRVLTLLPRCENPEEVLCITFTRKAATEMQERITAAIRLAAEHPRPDTEHEQQLWDLAQAVIEHDKQKNWQLLNNPNRLRIQTIDGLCRTLINHNPLSSGAGGSGKILDQAACQMIYRQAVEHTLQALEQDGNLQQPLSQLLQHMDNNLESVSDLLMQLLQCREQWLTSILSARDARMYLEHVLNDLVTETLQEVADLLMPHASDLCLLADYAGINSLKLKPESNLCGLAGIDDLPECDADHLPQWRLLCELLFTKKHEWRSAKGLKIGLGFPTETDTVSKAEAKAKKADMALLIESLRDTPKLQSLLTLVRVLPNNHYSDSQWRMLDALTHILPYCVAQLKMVFRQLNACDFIEITQGAIAALGSDETPTDLALILDYQIKHILVDEFQDTASPQLQLLERLTLGWEPDDGRSLFIVGDGMQSCYGFRNANVGIFLDARAHGIGNLKLTPLELTVNFRSQEGVVNWINETFQQAFPDSDDIARGAVTYAPSIAFKPPLDTDAIHTQLFTASDNRQAEAEHAVKLVKAARENHPNDRIAILVRVRNHLKDIIPALQRAGIHWQATDIDPLASRMAVIDLMTLTRALLEPTDRIAWLALLRTPWCGLNHSDLHTLASRSLSNVDETSKPTFSSILEQVFKLGLDRPCDRHSIAEQPLSNDGQTILMRFAAVMQHALTTRRRKSLRLWVEGVWTSLGGPECLTDSSDFSNAQDFFNLLARHDNGGSIDSWSTFELAVSKLYARPSANADPLIQVMTIHKSKGLEFEHVIIPGLDHQPNSGDRQLLLWRERINHQHESQLLLSPLSAFGEETDGLYAYLKYEQKLKNELEAIRLLYVGCTRAIKHLHLLGEVKIDPKKDVPRTPSSTTFLGALWPSVQHQYHLTATVVRDTGNDLKVWPSSKLRRLPATWLRTASLNDDLLASYRGREFDDAEDNVPSADSYRHRSARHVGTLLHRCLCQIVIDGIDQWTPKRLRDQRSSWQVQLKQLGLFSDALEHGLDTIQTAVTQMLNDPTGRWLLDNTHTQSAVELELWSAGKKPRLSIIDRTFIDKGQRWIVDYKSSIPNVNQSKEEFLKSETEAYQDQLQRYRQLFSHNTDTDVITALYFPLIEHLEIVEFED